MDEFINEALKPFTDALNKLVFFEISLFEADVPLIVLWLMAAAVFLRFISNF